MQSQPVMSQLLLLSSCAAAAFFALLVFLPPSHGIGWYKEAPRPWPSVVKSPLPHELINPESLPMHFDWRDTHYLSPPTNQFLPYPCGACWAHGSTGALTDRFVMKTGVVIPHLSIQALLDCGREDTLIEMGSCEGGSDILAYNFIYNYGVTDSTCSPYMGVVFTNWAEGISCTQRMCRQCDVHGNCFFVNGTLYRISEFGNITGEVQMMAELFARGPIACSVYAHTDSFLKYTSGVIRDSTPYNMTTHVIALIGWGVDDEGVNYWIGRNSFGTEWGEGGWFKIERGKNTLNIEEHPCTWAVPKV